MTNQRCSIVRYDSSGRGIADYIRPDGQSIPVAVPGSIVGEVVEIGSLVKVPKGPVRREGELCAVITPSPHRVVPRCPHVGECGGCVWQHIEGSHQSELKQELVAALFLTLGVPENHVRPIIASAQSWRYRNKMEFSFSEDREGNRFLGLFQRGRRRSIFNLDTCFLTNPWMPETLQSVRLWWQSAGVAAYRPSGDEGSVQTVTMRESATTGDRMVILTVSGNPDFALRERHLADFVTHIQRTATPLTGSLSIILRIRQIAKKMATQYYEMLLFGPDHLREELTVEPVAGKPITVCFHVSPQAFFQPNTLQAEKLYNKALEMAGGQSLDHVLDLYAGTSTLGILFSSIAKKVTSIEINPHAVFDAEVNKEKNQMKFKKYNRNMLRIVQKE